MKKTIHIVILILFLVLPLDAARIKDIAKIEGITHTQVIGYGIVAGLRNSGDNQQASFTLQSVENMLKRFGLKPPVRDPRLRNVAAVMITASVPTYSKRGSKIDVQVSSIGNATSLQGGILLMSPMSMSDGSIVGMAQGAVSVGGYDVEAFGSRLTKNVTTTGRVPGGLILEQNIMSYVVENGQMNQSDIVQNDMIRILLNEPDFTTAQSVATRINNQGGLGTAEIVDPGTIQVQLPAGQSRSVQMELIAQIESLDGITTNPTARVVINERTGTIVVGGQVELLPSVVAHSGLEISIQKKVIVPQPPPFIINSGYYDGTMTDPSSLMNWWGTWYGYWNGWWNGGRIPKKLVRMYEAEIKAREELTKSHAIDFMQNQVTTAQDLAEALNSLGLQPRDLIAIFQALKEAGSLQGELIIQ